MPNSKEFIQRLYDGFNARKMEEVLAALHPDVQWANGMEGGFVHGRSGVRDYWSRQWAMIDPHVEPLEIKSDDGDKYEVKVHQVIRDLNGNLLLDVIVGHVFQIHDGLVTRFEVL